VYTFSIELSTFYLLLRVYTVVLTIISNNGRFLSDLNHIMDSECPLPIPMDRPYLIDDARYDTPLPFRPDQATELTAENSSLYSLPKPFRPSMLERSPYEIREQIYGRLGIEYILRSRSDEDCRLDLLAGLKKNRIYRIALARRVSVAREKHTWPQSQHSC
jgi:hypothetical protein